MGLREVREDKGLTQEELEAASGVEQTTISLLERQPDPNPKWHTVRALKRALGVPAEALFRDRAPRERRV